MPTYPLNNRDAALVLLQLGIANLSEVARLAGVERSVAAGWAKSIGIDPFERREGALQRNWESAVHGGLRVHPKHDRNAGAGAPRTAH